MNVEELWDRAYGLSSLSTEVITKAALLLSYLKTLSVGSTRVLILWPPAQ